MKKKKTVKTSEYRARLPRKRAVNLSLNKTTVAAARALTDNLSELVNELLKDFVREKQQQHESELENYRKAALWANEVLEKSGSLSDEFSTL